MTTFYKDTRVNGKLVALEDVIEEIFNEAMATIDDGIVNSLLDNGFHQETNDEFWPDYNECFDGVLQKLNKRYEEIKEDN